ncbi:hypothetical protein WR25_15739 [Diploscapter pachys]|uniref:STAS domain-containing protein n=1 Tax=Diploscapter pachys TaxID=2018661 RepID=A0A2A2KYH3_9BILA|nr:hypothetical protein WR25_15739 [Diploscapter pachys]
MFHKVTNMFSKFPTILLCSGMAYSSLAGVPPMNGIYSSFFASSVYMLFGTSRHISIGVFAVASMMVGAAKLRLAPTPEEWASGPGNGTTPPLGEFVSVLEFTSALTMAVGIVQLILAICRLGFLTTYLSDPLVAGFTTGSAAHVLTSQLNKVFGVKLPRHEGVGMLPRMWRDIVLSLPKTNFITLAISIFGILFLDLSRTFLTPQIKKFISIPPPLELILVIFGVAISMIFELNEYYNVTIVNTIQRGIPTPALPNFAIMPMLVADAIPTAIVCFMFVVSMGKLFAKKHHYRVDPTQELFAMGLMSTAASFFPVYPVGASLSRSSVCEMSGANTLLYTVFSSLLVLSVILFIGPYLEVLPMAIWLVACLLTVFTDVINGLIFSLAFALITLVLRQQWPTFKESHPDATPRQHVPSDVRILRFDAPLHFANVGRFTDSLAEEIESTKEQPLLDSHSKQILLDCTNISYIDSMGIDAITEAYTDAKKHGRVLLFCGFNETVLKIIKEDKKDVIPESAFQNSMSGLKETLTAHDAMIFREESISPIFSKPKLIPLKTITMEKMERMQREAAEKMKEDEMKQQAQEEEVPPEDPHPSTGEKKQADVWSADD